ncbi:MAG: hypothetical protein RLZ37_1237 [Actinomycetota bacterium]|jgi:hypothetical protein
MSVGGMIGADPDQLSNLGATLSRQRDSVEAIVTAVTQSLSGTMWIGPARQSFETEWTTSFRTVLSKLSEAFDLAGRDCVVRADELRRVMGLR